MNKYQCVVYITYSHVHVRLSLIHTCNLHHFTQLKVHFVSTILKSAKK